MQPIRPLHQSQTLRQLIRFGVAGGFVSGIYSLIYLLLAIYILPPTMAVVAVPPAFGVALVFSFLVHSRWSFKGHGSRKPGIDQQMRFVAVQVIGLTINAMVTWLCTAFLHLPPWAPLVPAVVVAALVTFVLNRTWVFR